MGYAAENLRMDGGCGWHSATCALNMASSLSGREGFAASESPSQASNAVPQAEQIPEMFLSRFGPIWRMSLRAGEGYGIGITLVRRMHQHVAIQNGSLRQRDSPSGRRRKSVVQGRTSGYSRPGTRAQFAARGSKSTRGQNHGRRWEPKPFLTD